MFWSFVINRGTSEWRRTASNGIADWWSETFDTDRDATRRWLGGGLMVASSVATGLLVADVAAIADPSMLGDLAGIFDAGDAATAIDPSTLTDTAADPSAYASGLDHPVSYGGSHLHFGQDGTYVEPGDTVAGHTADSNHDPVQWSNGKYINARTGEQVISSP